MNMQQRILKSGMVSKIVFLYTDGIGISKKEVVNFKYMDKKHCYLQCMNSLNFHKPKWRAKATILTYTPEGIYEATVIIRDAVYSQGEILFQVDVPKSWNFKQLRIGSRKPVELPVKIFFPDDIEIEAYTKDISIGGFAIIAKHNLTTVQKNLASTCSIQFPKDLLLNFPDGKLEASIKYVRSKLITDDYELANHSVISFKFLNLNIEQKTILKSYLVKI